MAAPASTPAASALAPAPSLAALFLTCLKIGAFSFGGGLSGWLHREFVLRHRWIDDEDFASSLAVA
jgi:chromate transporter